jgi:hypothetical protein
MPAWIAPQLGSPAGRRWRNIARKATRGPVFVQSGGRTSHVVLSLRAYDRLASAHPDSVPAATVQPAPADPEVTRFSVLCRIDAYADYVALVEAECPEEAVQLACDEHAAYRWEHHQTAEFDDRLYVALDDQGNEIEGTEISDF